MIFKIEGASYRVKKTCIFSDRKTAKNHMSPLNHLYYNITVNRLFVIYGWKICAHYLFVWYYLCQCIVTQKLLRCDNIEVRYINLKLRFRKMVVTLLPLKEIFKLSHIWKQISAHERFCFSNNAEVLLNGSNILNALSLRLSDGTLG